MFVEFLYVVLVFIVMLLFGSHVTVFRLYLLKDVKLIAIRVEIEGELLVTKLGSPLPREP